MTLETGTSLIYEVALGRPMLAVSDAAGDIAYCDIIPWVCSSL